MKSLNALLISSVLISSVSFAKSQMKSQFMPDNELWREDSKEMLSNIDQEVFNKIIDAAYKVYKPFADKNNETLKINKKWTTSTVNANCERSGKLVTINMFGGLARRSEVIPDAFALVLCHELGHAYGGTPYVHPEVQMSAEGQSDYYGAKECLVAVLPTLPSIAATEFSPFMESKCSEKYSEGSARYQICLRSLAGGQSLGNLLSALKGDSKPDYETPDQTVVDETLTSYPDTTQCRLDTYLNGALKLARPACWFKK